MIIISYHFMLLTARMEFCIVFRHSWSERACGWSVFRQNISNNEANWNYRAKARTYVKCFISFTVYHIIFAYLLHLYDEKL